MLTRRQFLTRTLQRSSLLAAGMAVPQFLARTAQAAEAGKETVLVVLEMTGGNDGLNTVIPYADDLYHKARPTLRVTKDQVVRVNDQIGLHYALRGLEPLLQKDQLALVQGVGYPNPDRSHFESMDIWQSADSERRMKTGWIGRSVPDLQDKRGSVPVFQIGPTRLPLALQGAPGGVVSINHRQPYRLDLGTGDGQLQKARRQLMEDLTRSTPAADSASLLQFVQRRQLQTYTTLDRLEELLRSTGSRNGRFGFSTLGEKLQLIARLIAQGFGTRVFYVSMDGFDTHAGQLQTHRPLLQQLADAVNGFFATLESTGQASRVLLLTFSEFGRRVQENGSGGTDHGAASCLFVAGPAVQGGPVGRHPSLQELDAGDLRHQIDFRQVYATLLDRWLGCDSRTILGGTFAHVDVLKKR